jgi:hypothetical protein
MREQEMCLYERMPFIHGIGIKKLVGYQYNGNYIVLDKWLGKLN